MVTQQPLFHWATDGASTSSPEFYSIHSGDINFGGSAGMGSIIPTAGKFAELHIIIDTAPGTGNNWLFELVVNGTPSTTLKGTIADTATTLDVTADQTVSAGDNVIMKVTPTSSPTAFTRIDQAIIWEPTTDGEYIMMGTAANVIAAGATERNMLTTAGTSVTWNTSGSLSEQLMGTAGTFEKWQVKADATPGAGETIDVTLMKAVGDTGSFSSTALTVQLDNASQNKGISSSVSFAADDRVRVEYTSSGASALVSLAYGAVWKSTTEADIPLIGGRWDNLNTTITEYNMINGSNSNNWNGTEANVLFSPVVDITGKLLRVQVDGAPGAGNSFDFSLMVNGTADANLVADVDDTNTSANSGTQTVSIDGADTLSLEMIPVSTPAANKDATWCLVINFGVAAAARTLFSGPIPQPVI